MCDCFGNVSERTKKFVPECIMPPSMYPYVLGSVEIECCHFSLLQVQCYEQPTVVGGRSDVLKLFVKYVFASYVILILA